jgi:D-alanine transaminase
MLVYLNGQFLQHADARVSVDDRGFLFADGIYEVARVYGGRVFEWDAHMARLADGCRALQLGFDGADALRDIASRLLNENNLQTAEATIYIQITRGAAPRAHAFPAGNVQPTVYVITKPFKQHPASYFSEGVGAITAPDTRWSRCDIKSISLLPNVLANQAAHAAGAFEAIFVRDGVAIEGSHSNFMAVIDGVVTTYPNCNYVLPGITRSIVLELAREIGIPVREGPVLVEDLFTGAELFFSGTTTEVMPIASVDGRTIRDGKPGPVTSLLRDAYLERVQQEARSRAA